VYAREGGRVVRAGALAIADGLVAPRPFWELLERRQPGDPWIRVF
jgi:hypothetical protein